MIVQALGIPAPPGLVAAMPRYEICGNSIWRRAGASFCRLSESHGPLGLEAAISASRMRQREDPIYRSPMPYFHESDLTYVIDPRDATYRAMANPSSAPKIAMIEVVQALRRAGVSLYSVGLTGSLAIGIEGAHSDIDLIVYGEDAERAYEFFSSMNGGEEGWKRTKIGGIIVSWTGASDLPHCPPLREYFSVPSPRGAATLRTYVPPWQLSALIYPPCVKAEHGYIISFDFSYASTLYEGGELEIGGLLGEGVLYLGTRETPGVVRRVSPQPSCTQRRAPPP